jgi:oxygen-independent coproporphyrinogen III oxidase
MTHIPKAISLYIHIPFCVRKCNYCDFYSIPFDSALADAYVKALCVEWGQSKKEYYLEHTPVQSIYFGGGTPSLLSVGQWQELKRGLIDNLTVAPDLEWTVECNPDSFTEEKALLWHSMGVTRLTIGIQSLNDDELRCIGRPHTSDEAKAVLTSSVLLKFKSIGADLMYGLPQQTVASFGRSLETVLSMDAVKHLSAYELTVAKNTPFGRQTDLPLPSEDDVCEMAKLLFAKTKAAGFERYEISNFAKKGHRVRHNQAYWDHSPYVGLGPAAHSYVHPVRWANVKNVEQYISLLNDDRQPIDFSETIDREKIIAEMIFLRLRTADGVDETAFRSAAGEEFYSGKRAAVLDEAIKTGLITHDKGQWALTEQGLFIADAMARKLV